MKRFGVCTILSIAALCALLSCSQRKAYADALLYMQITGVQGASYESEDVYPYYGTANANPVWLMCISFTADMNIGETWTAEKQSIPGSSTFEEAVWLFNDANVAVANYNAEIAAANAATDPAIAADDTALAAGYTAQQIADQWAAWELFSPSAYNSPPPGAVNQMDLAVANYASEPAGFYQKFILYAPVPGTESELGTPQFFLGYGDQTPNAPNPYGGTPTTPAYGVLPEPGTLGLMGTGLLGLVGMLRRKLPR
jgi:hypothetical protein